MSRNASRSLRELDLISRPLSFVQVDRREPRGKRYTATGGGVSKSTDFDHARVFSQKPATQHILRRNSKPGSRQNASNNTGAGSNNALMSNSSVNDFRSHRAGATEIIEQQRICAPKSDAEASRSVSVNAGCDNAAARAGGVFGSGSSFGSVMPDKPASVGRSTWNSSKFKVGQTFSKSGFVDVEYGGWTNFKDCIVEMPAADHDRVFDRTFGGSPNASFLGGPNIPKGQSFARGLCFSLHISSPRVFSSAAIVIHACIQESIM